MSWAKHHKFIRTPHKASVRIQVEVNAKTRNKRPRAFLVLNNDVIARLVQMRFDILIGEGEHRGKLRLVTNPAGQFVARPQGKLALRYRITLGPMPGLPMDRSSTIACEFEHFDGGIVVTLPAASARAKAA
jgi:hypothetical protein